MSTISPVVSMTYVFPEAAVNKYQSTPPITSVPFREFPLVGIVVALPGIVSVGIGGHPSGGMLPVYLSKNHV